MKKSTKAIIWVSILGGIMFITAFFGCIIAVVSSDEWQNTTIENEVKPQYKTITKDDPEWEPLLNALNVNLMTKYRDVIEIGQNKPSARMIIGNMSDEIIIEVTARIQFQDKHGNVIKTDTITPHSRFDKPLKPAFYSEMDWEGYKKEKFKDWLPGKASYEILKITYLIQPEQEEQPVPPAQ